MSTGAKAVPAIEHVVRKFEVNSSLQLRLRAAATLACPAILLVGRTGSWGSSILKSLEKFGCELSYADPLSVTADRARQGAYSVILLDSTVPPELRREVASELAESEASIFYTFPVEQGCWWVPALRRGQDCHGTPAFRHNEFPAELERILRQLNES